MTKLPFCVAVALGFSSTAVTAATISLEAPGLSIPVEVSNGFESGNITLISPNGGAQDYVLPANSQSRVSLAANALADGAYQYRIDLVGAETQLNVAADDASGRTAASHSRVAMAPVEGAFRIADGQLVPANLFETSSSPTSSNPNNASAGPRPNDQVIPDDLIVQGSICAGFDCVNNESFGFDTLRLKENSTRIAFADTSVGGAFPATNWELTANDSASGGANRFSIADITAATVPFTVTGAAPSNSLFVSSLGRIGLGTSAPVLKVHVAQGDTPAVRLDQDGSAGFGAQVWDVAGSEASFFVRDVTGGSRLPLRIRPGAPTSSVDVAASGNVGIGTASPAARLDVMGDAIVRGARCRNSPAAPPRKTSHWPTASWSSPNLKKCRSARGIIVAATRKIATSVRLPKILVRNLQTQGMPQSTITTPNGANAATVAGRDAQDRVYFITGISGAQTLQDLPYALATSPAGVGLSAGYRVTHAAYDAQRTRIVSLAFDIPLTSAFINAINPASAATTVLKPVDPEWVSYRAGVIAYLALPNQLYLVGKTAALSEDRLLRFDLGSAASPLTPVDFDVAGEVLLALAAHPATGVLYGLSKSLSSSITRLVRFDFTPGFTVVALGVGDVDCCSVLVGSPAIDVATNSLYAVTRKGDDPARLRRFNLSPGVITELGTTVSAGLFADPTPPLFDRIFANGFD